MSSVCRRASIELCRDRALCRLLDPGARAATDLSGNARVLSEIFACGSCTSLQAGLAQDTLIEMSAGSQRLA
jgi:hypothetical protein